MQLCHMHNVQSYKLHHCLLDLLQVKLNKAAKMAFIASYIKFHKILLHIFMFQNILSIFFYFEKKIALLAAGGGGGRPPPP